jgi:hypothetical protein
MMGKTFPCYPSGSQHGPNQQVMSAQSAVFYRVPFEGLAKHAVNEGPRVIVIVSQGTNQSTAHEFGTKAIVYSDLCEAAQRLPLLVKNLLAEDRRQLEADTIHRRTIHQEPSDPGTPDFTKVGGQLDACALLEAVAPRAFLEEFAGNPVLYELYGKHGIADCARFDLLGQRRIETEQTPDQLSV